VEISYLIERPEYLVAVILCALLVIGMIIKVIREDQGDDDDEDDPEGGSPVTPDAPTPVDPKASVLSFTGLAHPGFHATPR
jgi:hypothetical protein